MCHYAFINKYPNERIPNKSSISRLVSKFMSTSSVTNAPKNRRRHVFTPEAIDAVHNVFKETPPRSYRKVAARLDLKA